jgi:hypothetical protein
LKKLLIPLMFLLTISSVFAWWNNDYDYRMVLNITNNDGNETLKKYHTVNVTIDTTSLISSGKMRSDCNDLRIVYNENTELNRTFLNETFLDTVGGCNNSNSVVMFMLQDEISISSSSSDYSVYYDYSNASSPPQDKDYIFLGYDDFNRAILGSDWLSTECYIVDNTLLTGDTANRLCQKNFKFNNTLSDLEGYELRYVGYMNTTQSAGSVSMFIGRNETPNTGIEPYGDYFTYLTIFGVEESGGLFGIKSYTPPPSYGTYIKYTTGTGSSRGNWYSIKSIHTHSDGEFYAWENGVQYSWSVTDDTTNEFDNVTVYGFGVFFNRAYSLVDNMTLMRVQKTPPTLSLLSEEEKPLPAVCGNSVCEIIGGEDQDNCCRDCGCPFHHRCENNNCVETYADVGAGAGHEVGSAIRQASVPLGGIVLFLGIIIILGASILGGIRDSGRR